MRVLLINEGGLGNLGDEAIRACLEHLLRSRGCQVEWSAFSRTAPSQPSSLPPNPMRRVGLRRFLRAIVPIQLAWSVRYLWSYLRYVRSAKFDLVLIGGGQLIQSNGVFAPAMFLWTLVLKRIRRRRVVILGVGVADRLTGLDRWLFGRSLRCVDGIYVRDDASARVISSEFGLSCRICPDPAFCITDVIPAETPAERRALFCPTAYGFYARKKGPRHDQLSEEQYLRHWVDRAGWYASEGYEVRFFCTNRHQDLAFVELLRNVLAQERGVPVELDEAQTLPEVCGLIQTAEVVVAGRMHALILAHAYGRKLEAFHTSEKIEAFEEEYLQPGCADASARQGVKNALDELLVSPEHPRNER